jgi:hypothetical protein
MMKDGEKPDEFILKMDIARKKLLEDVEFEIEENQYLHDILCRLPKGKENSLGPYQMVRRLLEPRVTNEFDTFDLQDLTLELMKVHTDMYGKSKDDESNDDDDDDDDGDKKKSGEKVFVGYTKNQFKGRCNKCGKIGHKGAECREVAATVAATRTTTRTTRVAATSSPASAITARSPDTSKKTTTRRRTTWLRVVKV